MAEQETAIKKPPVKSGLCLAAMYYLRLLLAVPLAPKNHDTQLMKTPTVSLTLVSEESALSIHYVAEVEFALAATALATRLKIWFCVYGSVAASIEDLTAATSSSVAP